MISIEAHRASIGRFFDKCKHLSNIDEHSCGINPSCFFSAYENYLVLHFNNIFGVNDFLHFNNIFRVSDIYDTSFLKLKQLIIDGDVETKPGPTQNTVGKSPMKGRPNKSKGFRGTPIKQKKCDEVQNIDFNISSNARDINIPLGLLNLGENVCFFNSVLYYLRVN